MSHYRPILSEFSDRITHRMRSTYVQRLPALGGRADIPRSGNGACSFFLLGAFLSQQPSIIVVITTNQSLHSPPHSPTIRRDMRRSALVLVVRCSAFWSAASSGVAVTGPMLSHQIMLGDTRSQTKARAAVSDLGCGLGPGLLPTKTALQTPTGGLEGSHRLVCASSRFRWNPPQRGWSQTGAEQTAARAPQFSHKYSCDML